MGLLSQLIDPCFARPLAEALGGEPVPERELQELFLRDVPNRKLSKRSLAALLDLCSKAGLAEFCQGTWRASFKDGIDQGVSRCIEIWSRPGWSQDDLFEKRCAAWLGQGIVRGADFVPLDNLSAKPALEAGEWAKLISPSGDIRRLCGLHSKHSEADYLMIYRNYETAPITDDADVFPRIPLSLLPALPSSAGSLMASARLARDSWSAQVQELYGDSWHKDFAEFIVYAKDLLDLLFWGKLSPLQSVVDSGHLAKTARALQNFKVSAEDLSNVWRGLPLVYRVISRLSFGLRYLSNNLSFPYPPSSSGASFVKICNLPASKQQAITVSRSGNSLATIIRPLRALQRALGCWQGRGALAQVARDCAAAISADRIEDKLLRREFSERVRQLNIISSVNILDALACELGAPIFPYESDAALSGAGLIASYSQFCESAQGRAHAELRLTLHAELDFQRRFNLHSTAAPQRYEGVWRGSLLQLVQRLEGSRGAFIPA